MIIDGYSSICFTFVSILIFLANFMLINNWVFLGFCCNDLCINNNSFSFFSSQSNDNTNSPRNNRRTTENPERHKGVHHLSDNSVLSNITKHNSREKYITAALERIQREKDDFDEL